MTTVANVRSRWLISVVAGLMLSTLPLVGVGAADDLTTSDAEADVVESAGSDTAAGGVEVVRFSAEDAYGLSVEVAEALVAQALVAEAGGDSDWVVLASGEGWADAVAAGPLAASLGAPVVLVPPGGLQTPTARADFVEFLRSSGVRRAVIVGSPELVPNHEPSVLFGLGMLPRNVERVYGTDLSSTSVAVARKIGAPALLGDSGRTVVVVSDHSVADAVAVGPLAAGGPFPLLLTPPDVLDPQIATYLTDHEVEHVVLVGGAEAVAPAVQEAIESAGLSVTRLAGKDRTETAGLAADLFEQHTADDPACTDGPARTGLASAQYPAQALTAGPLLAQLCSPLRYIDPDQLPRELHNTLYLTQHQSPALELRVFGDQGMIPDTVVDVSLPPTQLAFISVEPNQENVGLRAHIAVADEHGNVRHFPRTDAAFPEWNDRWPNGVCRMRDLIWSPNGRFLSYRHLCTADVFVLDTESGESYRVEYDEYELTFEDPEYEGGAWYTWRMGPIWSPDGRHLIFTSFVDDPATLGTWQGHPLHFAELFVHDAVTRSTRRLTTNARHDLVGPWSPDGTVVGSNIHWEPIASDPYYRVGVHARLIDVETGRGIPGSSFSAWASSARWSPDGSHLAYQVSDGWWTEQAMVMKTDGTARQQLTPHECDECNEGHKHTGAWIFGWNPAGSLLAFGDTDYAPGEDGLDYSFEHTQHYVLDLTSSEVSTLLEFTVGSYDVGPLYFLEWSREGDSLLYVQRGDEESDPGTLVRIDVNGGTITPIREIPPIRLSEDRHVHARLIVSPDQSQLLLIYDGRLPGEDPGMWLTGLEQSELRELINFAEIIALAEGDDFTYSQHWPPNWRCLNDWTNAGVLSSCEYRRY